MKKLPAIRAFFLKILTLTAVLALTVSAAASDVRVVNTDTRVYQAPNVYSHSVSLPKGTEVSLIAEQGGWAMIGKNGIVGYTSSAHLSEAAPAPDISALLANAEDAVITANTAVYQYPAASAARIAVPAGMRVKLLAVSGEWAMVYNLGVTAYMDAALVTPLSDVQITPVATPTPAPAPVMVNAPAVITANTFVYQYPTVSSARIAVSAGMRVQLISVSGAWAMVQNMGITAYMNAAEVIRASDMQITPAVTPTPAPVVQTVPAVITANTFVYQSPSTSSARIAVPAGMQVQLAGISGAWAMVRNMGITAYMNAALVTPLSGSAVVTPSATVAPTPKPDYSSLLATAKDAVLTANCPVYESADTNSDSIILSAGTPVRLLAVNGGWALIEKDGAYGFTAVCMVAEAATPSPAPTAAPAPTPTPAPIATPAPPADYLSSSAYSNEQKIFIFLTTEGGLNSAAAAGILANIYRESRFNPASGSNYYGLCQWGGGRLTNLKNFCANNGYEVSSLEGQLRFLMHELSNSYPSILTYLKNVSDTAQGAYDAGYYFCYHFERPSNKASKSVTRGELARDTYFPKYN